MRVGDALTYIKGLRTWRQRSAFVLARTAAQMGVRTPRFLEDSIAGRFLTPEGNWLDLRPGLDYLIGIPVMSARPMRGSPNISVGRQA